MVADSSPAPHPGLRRHHGCTCTVDLELRPMVTGGPSASTSTSLGSSWNGARPRERRSEGRLSPSLLATPRDRNHLEDGEFARFTCLYQHQQLQQDLSLKVGANLPAKGESNGVLVHQASGLKNNTYHLPVPANKSNLFRSHLSQRGARMGASRIHKMPRTWRWLEPR